ncbi:MAG: hypothetical protein NC489_31600, partial [Ruminococcus flavefaciens]|nr:hypothetical protein [Ruminococcus flavefaciens]
AIVLARAAAFIAIITPRIPQSRRLLRTCAERGILCVLVRMPNLAVLNINGADGIKEQFPEIGHRYTGETPRVGPWRHPTPQITRRSWMAWCYWLPTPLRI